MSRQDIPQGLVSYDSVVALVGGSVAEILRHQDAGRYLDWMRANAKRFLGALPVIDEAQRAAMAVAIGRGIWNAVPLPDNQFRPRPLPEPGRNDPCPCGSGHKYKQCCAGLPQLETMATEDIWPVMIEHLTREQVDKAVRMRRLPPLALGQVAMRLVEQGEAERAVELVGPLFEGPLEALDARHEQAFDALCDAYLRLGEEESRWALVEKIAARGSATMRRAAWQRLAVMRRDAGDIAGAWQAFRKAQQAEPDDASLSLTEVLLLMTERRMDEAAARARFWAARLRREGYPDEDLIAKLEQLAADPARTMGDLFLQDTGIALEPLRAWVERAVARPIPAYAPEACPVIDPSDPDAVKRVMHEYFTAQGLCAEDVQLLAQGVADDLSEGAREAQRTGDADPTALAQRLEAERETDASQPDRLLRAPEALAQLEVAWHQVFPCRKPMSTAPFPEDGNDPWLEQTRNDWIAFLQRRPEAADSLDILDDVVMALLPLEASFPQGARDGLAARLVERAQRIVERALGDEAIELPWGVPHNRPALRLLARGIELRAEHGEHDQAVALVERMLRLNPKDNHGFRALLMTHRLRVGDLAGAQDLLERYPDDAAVELRYGEVLLRLKQGDPDAARAALAIAHKCNPHVPAALRREDAKPPRGEGAWVAWGSPEEAWEYREEARELWLAVPGALEWLAENARALPGKARRTPGPRRGGGKGKRHRKRRS